MVYIRVHVKGGTLRHVRPGIRPQEQYVPFVDINMSTYQHITFKGFVDRQHVNISTFFPFSQNVDQQRSTYQHFLFFLLKNYTNHKNSCQHCQH